MKGGAITEKTCSMFGLHDEVEPQDKESSKARISQDECDVQSLTDMHGTIMANPFDVSEEHHGHLINLVK